MIRENSESQLMHLVNQIKYPFPESMTCAGA